MSDLSRSNRQSARHLASVEALLRCVLTAAAAALAVVGVGPPGAAAQESAIVDACERPSLLASGSVDPGCAAVARSVVLVQPRLLLAAGGGNPVPGTGSTLGVRIGTSPRWSLSIRATGTRLRALSGVESTLEGSGRSTAIGLGADAAVGLFRGFTLAPTVGGVGSVDLLGSAGVVFPGGDFGRARSGGGEGSTRPFTWSFGLRAGLFRESFTLPGVSLSGTYRSVGRVSHGDPDPIGSSAYWSADLSALGARLVASKNVLGVGLAIGAGLDRVNGDARIRYPSGGSELRDLELEQDRMLLFGSISYTLVVLHGVAEVGWQNAHDGTASYLDSMLDTEGGDGGAYGSLALRLSI